MAIRKIVHFPEQVLREKPSHVKHFDAELEELANDMFETMYDAPGVGLAANQIGVLKRIAVIDVDYSLEGDDEATRKLVNPNPRVLVNPTIVSKGGEILFNEGCLSVPGFAEEVKRFDRVKVRFQDLKGASHELEAEGLLAVAVQHEVDHLDGKLFIDRLSITKKNLIKGKLKRER
jgi:peptide deformylase